MGKLFLLFATLNFPFHFENLLKCFFFVNSRSKINSQVKNKLLPNQTFDDESSELN